MDERAIEIRFRVSQKTRDTLETLCKRSKLSIPELIEQLAEQQLDDPNRYFAHCAAVQTNAIYYLMGQLTLAIFKDHSHATEVLKDSIYYAREIYGPTPAPPAHLVQRDVVDPKIAALFDAFFPVANKT